MTDTCDAESRAAGAGRWIGTELTAFEERATLARARHTAIRRLHLAGVSLREVAEARSFTHQRVHQIVDGSGGSW
ncbi:MAG TPA: hypothetical protein VL173_06005 [Vicinamibacterales bacterium]|jgi:hypothetical protein|nr:hypothetical protein [Vicinamibacterales bacterium]